MTEWNERSNGGPSQGVAEAGGSPALEAQGAGGSRPDNDGTGRHCQTVWVRQARREGVARANQWLNPSSAASAPSWRIWAEEQCTPALMGRATSASEFRGRRGGHEEGLRRSSLTLFTP